VDSEGLIKVFKKITLVLPEHLPTHSQETALTTESSNIRVSGIMHFNIRVFTAFPGKQTNSNLNYILES
jgi:hypothetical protein